MSKAQAFFSAIAAAVLVLAVFSILTILQIYYTNKTQVAIKNNNLNAADKNMKIAVGFIYFFSAVALLSAVGTAIQTYLSVYYVSRNGREIVNDVTALTKDNEIREDLAKLRHDAAHDVPVLSKTPHHYIAPRHSTNF